MHMNLSGLRRRGWGSAGEGGKAGRVAGGMAAAGMVLMAALAAFSQSTPEVPKAPKPVLRPEANRLPDANEQMKLREGQKRKANFDAANSARLRQMSQDSDRLLTMAMALKAEVDQTHGDALSANALRKAEVIETLARGVKEKMKLTITPN